MKPALFALVVCSAAACTRWVELPGPAPVEARRLADSYREMRVQRSDGTRFHFYNGTIRGDTLIGELLVGQVSVPFRDIDAIEVKQVSVVRTLLAFAGLGAAIVVVLVSSLGDYGG